MSTQTYAVMEVTDATFDAIEAKLKKALLTKPFHNEGKDIVLSGIALRRYEVPIPGKKVSAL